MEESCSWVTRAKFSPTVYLRSASSGLAYITYCYKSDRLLDLQEKGLVYESRSGVSPSGSTKEDFEPGSCLQLKTVNSVSEAKKNGTSLDSPLASSTVKADWRSSCKLKGSNIVFSASVPITSSLQHGSIQSSSHTLKGSNSQSDDFSFHPHVTTKPNPMKDSTLVSSDSLSCKSFTQHDHSQSLSPLLMKSFSRASHFSFNPDVGTVLPQRDSNLVSSGIFSSKSRSHHHHKQFLNPVMNVSNLQSVDFSSHFDASANSKTRNLESCAIWFTSSKKKVDPMLHNSCFSSDQKGQKSQAKQRSVSPLPRSILSDTFKEAKSISKRFSTPPPCGEPEKYISEKHYSLNDWNSVQQVSYGKGFNKREKKETRRARYFDSGGIKVTALETTDKWMVDLSELYFGARFAFGAHSRLYYGKYKNEPVAIKIIRLPDDDDENEVMTMRLEKQFIREATFLSHLYHRNVIKLAGACKKSPVFFIITEYLSGGSLRAFLHKLDRKPLPLDKLISILLDVSRGMEYIHSQGVIHRDLKPENILFDHNFCVKIADFGVACEEAYCDVLEDDAGTYRWMAPEMIKHKPYGRKVDVYSFGLLLWEMITGSIPYEEMSPVQAAFAVVNKNMRPVIPSDSPVVLRILIEQCWSTLPEERLEFWQIVKVLEQFESDLVCGNTLEQVQNFPFQDHKNWLLEWVEKLRPPKVNGFRPTTSRR